MAPKETKISKHAAAGTSHIILTIPNKLKQSGSMEVQQARLSLWQLLTIEC
jgi:hypothetical protein